MNRSYVVRIALFIALGGFLMGFDTSVISGLVRYIEPYFGLSKLQLGWAVACLTLIATVTMLVAGPISDKIGRKSILSFAALFSELFPNQLRGLAISFAGDKRQVSGGTRKNTRKKLNHDKICNTI